MVETVPPPLGAGVRFGERIAATTARGAGVIVAAVAFIVRSTRPPAADGVAGATVASAGRPV
jgi:hypothetical protein